MGFRSERAAAGLGPSGLSANANIQQKKLRKKKSEKKSEEHLRYLLPLSDV